MRENSDNSAQVRRDLTNKATCVACDKEFTLSDLELKLQQEGREKSLCPHCWAREHGCYDEPTEDPGSFPPDIKEEGK